MTTVSIIIPIHNAGNYLADCLASVERQTLQDFEVLCVDDASTDDSYSICRLFAESDPRFRIIRFAANKGVAAARNEGIRQARGEFVAFIDADDWYPNDRALEWLYQAAVDHGVDVAGGKIIVYDTKADEYRTDYRNAGHLSLYHFDESGLMDYREWQGDYGFYRFIYKRDLLVDNGICFPALIRHEDPVFMVKAMIAAKRFYALAENVYCYRINHKSYELSAKAVDDAVEAHVEMLLIAERNDLQQLRAWVVETLRWYLVAYAPEVRELYHEIDELHEGVEEILNSRTYRLGELFARPIWAVRGMLGLE